MEGPTHSTRISKTKPYFEDYQGEYYVKPSLCFLNAFIPGGIPFILT